MRLEEEIQSKFRNEYNKAFVNIYYTNSILHNQFTNLIKEFGLTATQFNVLRILRGQHPKAISNRNIKERMVEKNSDVSRIIDRLLKKELIERTASAADRRRKDIRISQTGLELLASMDHCVEQLDQMLSNLNEEEITQLNFLLDKIRN